MNRYSALGGRLLAEKGKISRSWPAFFWNMALVPMLTFVWNYIFRLGFLDGREGLLLHLYHSATSVGSMRRPGRSARDSSRKPLQRADDPH